MSLLCSIDGEIGPSPRRASRSPTTGSCAATAPSRCCGSTTAGRSRSRTTSTGSTAPPTGIFLEWDRPAFEREIDALLAANDEPRRAPAARAHARRAADRDRSSSCPPSSTASRFERHATSRRSCSPGSRRSPTGQHDRDAHRAEPRRRRGAAGAARRHGARGADLDDLLGRPATARSTRRSWTPASSPRSRASGSCKARAGRGGRLQAQRRARRASEVFLASSVREVQGVAELDGARASTVPDR